MEDLDVMHAGMGISPPNVSIYRKEQGRMGLSFMAAVPRYLEADIDVVCLDASERLREIARHGT